jgi:tryptophan halogenase
VLARSCVFSLHLGGFFFIVKQAINDKPSVIMNKLVNHLVIVGGGTAGWLSAGVLAAKLKPKYKVTLIESPNVPTIGVGEGSWPSLRDTLMDIGIRETEFLSVCQGTFKQGSSFINWRTSASNSQAISHHYHHPFTAPSGYQELDIHACWQSIANQESYENSFSLQSQMCKEGKAPKQATTPDYAHVLNYGYHFDATALAMLLKQHCLEKLGVNYVSAHVSKVEEHDNGYIRQLITDNGQTISGDLFIDCSGKAGTLIQQHYKVPWLSIENTMLNNRAMAVQVPYATNDRAISSTTVATAQSIGWTWDIGLQHRRGVGLVYASEFCNEDAATEVLFNQVSQRLSNAKAQDLTVRSLSFNPGYRQAFWVKNCLSLGMSSGFVEPLEASAIAMVELGLRMLCESFPHNIEHMEHVSRRYNQRFEYRWQRVVDFLKLHYVLSKRNEPYWLAQRHESRVPPSLSTLLDIWKYQSPSRLDLIENEEIFPSASYQYVLYGMGYNTALPAVALSNADLLKAKTIRSKMAQTKQAYLHALPSNRALLDELCGNSEEKRNKEHSHVYI